MAAQHREPKAPQHMGSHSWYGPITSVHHRALRPGCFYDGRGSFLMSVSQLPGPSNAVYVASDAWARTTTAELFEARPGIAGVHVHGAFSGESQDNCSGFSWLCLSAGQIGEIRVCWENEKLFKEMILRRFFLHGQWFIHSGAERCFAGEFLNVQIKDKTHNFSAYAAAKTKTMVSFLCLDYCQ